MELGFYLYSFLDIRLYTNMSMNANTESNEGANKE